MDCTKKEGISYMHEECFKSSDLGKVRPLPTYLSTVPMYI